MDWRGFRRREGLRQKRIRAFRVEGELVEAELIEQKPDGAKLKPSHLLLTVVLNAFRHCGAPVSAFELRTSTADEVAILRELQRTGKIERRAN